jgi:hypothetical protein
MKEKNALNSKEFYASRGIFFTARFVEKQIFSRFLEEYLCKFKIHKASSILHNVRKDQPRRKGGIERDEK